MWLSKPEQAVKLDTLLKEAQQSSFLAFDLLISERMRRGTASVPPSGACKASMFAHSLAVVTAAGVWVVQLRREFADALRHLLALPVLKVRSWHEFGLQV